MFSQLDLDLPRRFSTRSSKKHSYSLLYVVLLYVHHVQDHRRPSRRVCCPRRCPGHSCLCPHLQHQRPRGYRLHGHVRIISSSSSSSALTSLFSPYSTDTCICTSEPFQTAALACLTANCTATEQQAALTLQSTLCGNCKSPHLVYLPVIHTCAQLPKPRADLARPLELALRLALALRRARTPLPTARRLVLPPLPVLRPRRRPPALASTPHPWPLVLPSPSLALPSLSSKLSRRDAICRTSRLPSNSCSGSAFISANTTQFFLKLALVLSIRKNTRAVMSYLMGNLSG